MKTNPALYLTVLLWTIFGFGCAPQPQDSGSGSADSATARTEISALLDTFNQRAARADYDGYFRLFSDDAVFIGTDPGERWDKAAFAAWAKPYFDRGKAWSFTALERHIYPHGDIAWFDELLETQMRICRGSGVVVHKNGRWYVQQYVLSATVPNPLMDSLVRLKAPVEDSLIRRLRAQPQP